MEKNDYRNYEKIDLGESAAARILLAGSQSADNLPELRYLDFGENSCYKAYLVDEHAEIGLDYILEASFQEYVKVYDDRNYIGTFEATEINFYRAGKRGCIVQLINGARLFKYDTVIDDFLHIEHSIEPYIQDEL